MDLLTTLPLHPPPPYSAVFTIDDVVVLSIVIIQISGGPQGEGRGPSLQDAQQQRRHPQARPPSLGRQGGGQWRRDRHCRCRYYGAVLTLEI